jgi:hypothetical protein
MNFVNPDVYDFTAKVHRPMLVGTEAVNPAMMPLSARVPNNIQVLGDGLYVGPALSSPIYYVNGATGVDDTAHGTEAAPFATLNFALSYVASTSPGGQYRSASTTIALKAGQTFSMTNDFNIYGGQLSLAFYGDPLYGDYNGALIGVGALPSVMIDLTRPIINFGVSNVNGQWHMAGFNRYGGGVGFVGVTLALPAAPTTPSITLYSQSCDVVRAMNYSDAGYIEMIGAIVNMTDIASFWGFLGINARAANTTLSQFSSQFQINGIAITAEALPTPAQLTARQYFIKMFADVAGNSTIGYLSPTALNSSNSSGLMNLSWVDTEALVVTGAKTSLPSFPINFDLNYGIRNYIFGLQKDQQNRPVNVISSRLF